MTLTDDDLHAYLSNALAPEKCAILEDALAAGDRQLEARLRALDPLAQDIQNAYSQLPDTTRIEASRAMIASHAHISPSPKWGALAAALIIGLGLGWTVQNLSKTSPNALDWRAQVAQYHSLYVPQTVSQINNPRLEDQFQNAEQALGYTFNRAALETIGALKLVRVQVLGFEGTPLIQLAYRDANGIPFALCLMKGADDVSGPKQLAGLESYSWSSDNLRLILIGGQKADFVKQHADLAKVLITS